MKILPFLHHRSHHTALLALVFGGLLCALLPLDSRAQDEPFPDPPTSSNPNGNSGGFSGMVTTAGAYDPLTGNAKRSITDLVVPGSQGAYPLAFSRTANSRRELTLITDQFLGEAGNWRHGYQWALNYHPPTYHSGGSPPYVAYPSGAVTRFSDDYSPSGEPWLRGPAGTSDRLEVIFTPPGQQADQALILHTADGGQVVFANRGSMKTRFGFPQWEDSYRAEKILDPHGATTLLFYDDANGHATELARVVEPGGRQLLFHYDTFQWTNATGGHNTGQTKSATWRALTQVSTPTGQSVTFIYDIYGDNGSGLPYLVLSHARYDNEPQGGVAGNPQKISANYDYNWPTNTSGGRPLLAYCDDPHYDGAMHGIRYTSDGSDLSKWGKVLSENNATTDQAVSTLACPQESPPVRFETRGDGPSRGFVYGEDNVPTLGPTHAQPFHLTTATDFSGQAVRYAYNGAGDARGEGYRNAVLDRCGNTTLYDTEPVTGRTTRVTLPDGAHRDFVYTDTTNPYYLSSVTDERGQMTVYHRDASTQLVTQIDYPDGGREYFSYVALSYPGGAPFYKVQTHTTVTGAVYYYVYDEADRGGTGNKGLLTTVWHSRGDSTLVPVGYWYDGLDRLQEIVDERPLPTWFDYNGRGQVTRTYRWTDHTPAISTGYFYDDYGNRTQVEDELHHVTAVGYDDYRRPTSVTVPVNADGVATRTTRLTYERRDINGVQTADALAHTSAAPGQTILPSGKGSRRVFYPNGWTWVEYSGMRDNGGTGVLQPSDSYGWSSWAYDAEGRVSSFWDRQGQLYTTTYDNRGRQQTAADPLGHVAGWFYYPPGHGYSGLLERVETPGLSPGARLATRFTAYDQMGRPQSVQDPAFHTTTSAYNAAGQLVSQTDGGAGHPPLGYTYDLLGRPTRLDYAEGTFEAWAYDQAGNLLTFRNRAGAIQTFGPYDWRHNGPSGYTWDDNVTPAVSLAYDDAGRMTTASNSVATLSWSYNDAGEQRNENVIYNGPAPRNVSTPRDIDGAVVQLGYPSGDVAAYGFDSRGRMSSVSFDSNVRAIYTYYGDWLWMRDFANGTRTESGYQANGRPTVVNNYRPGGAGISYRTYGWAPNGQMTWFNKSYDASSGSATESDRGDAYQYYQDGTLSFVHHEAKNVFTAADSHGDSIANPLWDPAQNSPQRANSYDYDAAGNRTHVNNSGVAETYTVDAFNRVTNVRNDSTNADSAVSYVDGQGRTQGAITGLRGWTYGYDAQGRLTSATTSTGGATFAYDPLGRVALRTLSGTVTRCYYAGRQLIEERNASDQRTATWLYGVGGELVEAFANGDYFFHHDARGFVTHLTDGSNGSTKGNVIEQYLYDAFGAPLVLDAAGNQRPGNGSLVGNRFRWRDSLYFSAYGLYHLDRRFYNPSLGRFLQPDPIGQKGGINLYAYCQNDPINRSDPSGLTNAPTAEVENGPQPAGRPSHTPLDVGNLADAGYRWDPSSGDWVEGGRGQTSVIADGRDDGRDANNIDTHNAGAGDNTSGNRGSGNGRGDGPGAGEQFASGVFRFVAFNLPGVNGLMMSIEAMEGAHIGSGGDIEKWTERLLLVGSIVGPMAAEGLASSGGFALGAEGVAGTASRAESSLSGQLLRQDLLHQEAASAFTATGELSPGAISSSKVIIPAGQLGNPNIPAGFSKMSTRTFQSPSGNFQVHYYQNTTTGNIYYGLDYKIKFQ